MGPSPTGATKWCSSLWGKWVGLGFLLNKNNYYNNNHFFVWSGILLLGNNLNIKFQIKQIYLKHIQSVARRKWRLTRTHVHCNWYPRELFIQSHPSNFALD